MLDQGFVHARLQKLLFPGTLCMQELNVLHFPGLRVRKGSKCCTKRFTFQCARKGSTCFNFQGIPCPYFPCFLEFLVFSPSEDFLVFLSVFPFFSRDFRGSVGIKNPCFFGGFPCLFKKKTRKGRTGFGTQGYRVKIGNCQGFKCPNFPKLEHLSASPAWLQKRPFWANFDPDVGDPSCQ